MANNIKKYDFKALHSTEIKKEGNNTIPQDYASYIANMGNYLQYFKNEWHTSSELSVIFGGLKQLTIRTIIRFLRKTGNPIIAGKKGYCYTDDKTLLIEYKQAREKEIADELSTIKNMYI